MTPKYFTTYTGCNDLYLVCYRYMAEDDGSTTGVEVVQSYPTQDEAKEKANRLNAEDMLAEIANFRGNLHDPSQVELLHDAAQALASYLYWDAGVYKAQRARREAEELAKANAAEDETQTYPNTEEGIAQGIDDAKAAN